LCETQAANYGVLGNHDTVRMLPGLGQMGIRMLLNECDTINRDDQCIFVVGIDDAHFYRADNIEKAASGIPSNAFSILLSHTPEIYQQAAHADFNVLLRIREATSIAVVCMTAISCSLRVLRTISRPLDRGA
jgi:predicted MPP superfamily phosphohydrolase